MPGAASSTGPLPRSLEGEYAPCASWADSAGWKIAAGGVAAAWAGVWTQMLRAGVRVDRVAIVVAEGNGRKRMELVEPAIAGRRSW